MKIIHLSTFLIGILMAINMKAQTIERSTFDIAGGVAKTDQFEVHYSLGQPFVKTIDLGDIVVSEGFIQGSIEEISTPIILFPNMEVGISPNPSFDILRIRTSQDLPKSTVMLFDTNGHVVIQKSFEPNMEIQVSQLPAGTYLLNWMDADQRLVRQFKMVKL